MAIPNITPLPPAPTRADGSDDFVEKADTFVAALPPMVTQTNTAIAGINQASTQVAADAAFAAAAADRAEAVDTNVSEQVTAAQAAANNAAASAAAAESAQGSIGNLALIHAMTIAMR